MKNCQACGMPIVTTKDMGHNNDGSINQDFCSSCYRDGEFTANQDPNTHLSTNILIPFVAVNDANASTGNLLNPSGVLAINWLDNDKDESI